MESTEGREGEKEGWTDRRSVKGKNEGMSLEEGRREGRKVFDGQPRIQLTVTSRDKNGNS
jgi:hypothetical protein